MLKDIGLAKLSVLVRAAEAYAAMDLSAVEARAIRLYPGNRCQFMISKDYPLPLHLFSPRLSLMLDDDSVYPDAIKIWKIITARENIIRMISATELGRTAAESLGAQFELLYPPESDKELSMKRKQMMGYMIKIVMEAFGYLVYRSRMQVDTYRAGDDREKRRANYFKSATRYAPLSFEDRDLLLDQMTDPKAKAIFKSITDLIISGKTEYQRLYRVNALSNWDTL